MKDLEMKMFFRLISIFITLFLSTISNANDLTIINNGSPTGINSQLLQEYVKEFSEFDVKVKTTNTNCALSKTLWNSSDNKILYVLLTNIDGSTDKNNSACFVEIKRENLLFVSYSAPVEFCSVGNKTWEDFIKPGSSHVIGITSTTTMFPEQILNEISRYYGNKLRIVRTNHNLDFMTMAKAGELDFGFRTGLKGLEFFKEKCIWDASDIDSKKLFPFLNGHTEKYNSLYEESVVLYKNLTQSEVNEFRHRFHRSWNTDASKSLRNRRGYEDNRVAYSSEKERLELFDRFLTKFK